ncbi:MAG: hypothetical protein E6I30_01280 [Chloroflexi bacterium]|nr:MAG: hypothetical protein E6I30_01280 [Chloroflexota bacterium]
MRGDHRPDPRTGLVRRPERRDRRHLRLADQAARRLRGPARVVKPRRPLRVTAASPIKHVVIIVKENHGYDNYFGTFPGGEGVGLPASPNPPHTRIPITVTVPGSSVIRARQGSRLRDTTFPITGATPSNTRFATTTSRM